MREKRALLLLYYVSDKEKSMRTYYGYTYIVYNRFIVIVYIRLLLIRAR